MKLFVGILYLLSNSGMAAEPTVFKCTVVNFDKIINSTTTTTESGGTITENEAEQVPFTLTVGKTVLVEMGGLERRVLSLKVSLYSAEHSVTHKPMYAVSGKLYLPSGDTKDGFYQGDIIAEASYYLPTLTSGIQLFLQGREDVANNDGVSPKDASAAIICLP